MKPAPFDYLAPRTIAETVAALAQHGDDAKVLAGGQSLVPMLNLRLAERIELGHAVHDLHVGGRRLEQRGGGRGELVTHPTRRHVDRRARVDGAPAGEGADTERDGGGVTPHHGDPVDGDAEGIRRHLGEGRLVALALTAGAGGDHRAT